MNNIKKQVFFNISNVLDNNMNSIKIIEIENFLLCNFIIFVLWFFSLSISRIPTTDNNKLGTTEIFGYLADNIKTWRNT